MLQLDENCADLKERYGLISKNKKFNEEKFKDDMIQYFGDGGENVIGESIYHVIKKYFTHIKASVDYKTSDDFRQYFIAVLKLMSVDKETINEIFFSILDDNRDRKVCETDLFAIMKFASTF